MGVVQGKARTQEYIEKEKVAMMEALGAKPAQPKVKMGEATADSDPRLHFRQGELIPLKSTMFRVVGVTNDGYLVLECKGMTGRAIRRQALERRAAQKKARKITRRNAQKRKR